MAPVLRRVAAVEEVEPPAGRGAAACLSLRPPPSVVGAATTVVVVVVPPPPAAGTAAGRGANLENLRCIMPAKKPTGAAEPAEPAAAAAAAGSVGTVAPPCDDDLSLLCFWSSPLLFAPFTAATVDELPPPPPPTGPPRGPTGARSRGALMTGPRRPVSLAMTPSALESARTNEEELLNTAAAATAASESGKKKRGMLASSRVVFGVGAVSEQGERWGGGRREGRKGEVKREPKPKPIEFSSEALPPPLSRSPSFYEPAQRVKSSK